MTGKKAIVLTTEEIIEQWQEFLTDCSAEQLASLTGQVFGGECSLFFDPDNSDIFGNSQYEFTPNDDYEGAFGEVE